MKYAQGKSIEVECPKCFSTYNISVTKIKDEGSVAKCKKCNKKFQIKKRVETEGFETIEYCVAFRRDPKKNDDYAADTGYRTDIASEYRPEKETMKCPRCHKEQPVASECAYCGIVLFKHFKKTDDERYKKEKNEKEGMKEPAEIRKRNSPGTIVWATAAVLLIAVSAVYFLRGGEMSTADLVAETERSVALIVSDKGSGSGFVIDRNLLATNFHVIAGAFPEDISVYFPSVGNDSVSVRKVVYSDEERDMALIEIDADQPPLPTASEMFMKHGDDLVIIGSPSLAGELILKNTVTRGTLNSENRIGGQKYIQISASINPGNSGGPAFNYKGEVVAMITLKATSEEGITFGIPVNEIVTTVQNVRMFSEKERSDANDMFIARVLFGRLSQYAVVNLTAMALYVEYMEKALSMNLTANEGLRYVSSQIDEEFNKINESISPEKIDKYLRRIHESDLVEVEIKKTLLDLWVCAKEIRDYVNNPRGNLDSYTDKNNVLTEECSRYFNILKIRLNVGNNI